MGGNIVFAVESQRLQQGLVQSLASDGYCAFCFQSVEDAVRFLREPACPAAVAVFSLAMRRQSDYVSLQDLLELRPELQIFLVGKERIAAAAALLAEQEAVCILDGSLADPAFLETLIERLERAAMQAQEAQEDAAPAASGSLLPYSEEFLRRVGLADVPVLLSGETGVGKEVMARRLCGYSRRAGKPFLKLNCAALPPELAESELFGSTKGAFTGATADRQGRFETAQGGTILLDEIGDMDLRLQTKLLQVLQDGEIQPLGSNRTIKVDVRVMAATHRDLNRSIQEGTFREDLYYRLNVVKIVIPPLRERRDEILPLAETLLARHAPAEQKVPPLGEELKRFLVAYRWPGNVRELENVMRRFLVYQDSHLLMQELVEGAESIRLAPSPISVTSVPRMRGEMSGESLSASGEGLGHVEVIGDTRRPVSRDRLAEASRIAETELLLNALESSRWNRRQAAASLRMEYKAFLYKMQKYGISESKRKAREISA